MARADDHVRAVQFTVETGLTPAEIEEACRRAAKAGRSADTTIEPAGEDTGDRCRFVARARGLFGPGAVQALFSVRWQADRPGCWHVSFAVDDYVSTRATVLGVPAGPWKVAALTSLRRFAEALKVELFQR